MSDLASFTSNSGQRTATALTSTVLGGGGGGVIPVRGVLITDTGDYFVTSGGDHIAYAQFRPTDSGVLLTSTGDNLVDDAGNRIAYLSF